MIIERRFYVYALFRPWDGSPFYVGKGSGDRAGRHLRQGDRHKNRRLAAILRRATSDGLEIPIVIVRNALAEAEAFETEKALIAAIGRLQSGPLVNLTDGGEGPAGMIITESVKAKLRAAHAGKPLSAEHRKKIGLSGIGRVVSAETREKIRRWRLGKPLLPAQIEATAAKKRGKPLKPEHRAKLSKALLGNKRSVGRKHSEETRAKMRLAHFRRHHDGG